MQALSFDAHSLTVPVIKWLGVLPSDINRYYKVLFKRVSSYFCPRYWPKNPDHYFSRSFFGLWKHTCRVSDLLFGYLTTGFDNFVVAPGQPCMGQALKNARVSTRQDYFGSLILILCLNVQRAWFYEPFLQCSNAATESSQSYQLDLGERRVAIVISFPLRLSEDDLERIISRRHEIKSQSLYFFETGVIING